MKLSLTLGDPVTRGPLTLYPLFSDSPPAPAYLPGPDAVVAGVIDVGEAAGGATVPTLEVTNSGETPVLLVEGETLLGAKQHRTLNVSVLLPARHRTSIPVSCVEAGRWGPPRPSRVSPRSAPPELRARKTRSVVAAARAGCGRLSDQGAVWKAVGEYALDFDADSPTHALEDVFDATVSRIEALVGDIGQAPGQCGVLVAYGGAPRVLECFDRPETLAAYWRSLLAGYALDATRHGEAPTAADAAEGFVRAVLDEEWTHAPAVGLGVEEHRADTEVTGSALLWGEHVVHLAAFASQPSRRGSWFRAPRDP